jgi:hypothetical protein
MKHHDASLTGCQIDDPEGSDASLILISRTPGPIVFIGFQFAGSLPFCAWPGWRPASVRASAGKVRMSARLRLSLGNPSDAKSVGGGGVEM